ncbi:MAG TPA: hypothetical protein VMW48_14550 [Vicinamibacterales bacterium]|nr:hypothetical protein [Vicinamibacterales bacterium]
MDLLDQASAWLDGKRKAHLSRPVTYQRGAESVEVQARVGRTVFEAADAYGVVERTESRDFLVLAADLVLGGAAVLPERGDRIRETDGAKVYVYEVMAPGKEPHWRWSDDYRRTLRIHTKHVATEAA